MLATIELCSVISIRNRPSQSPAIQNIRTTIRIVGPAYSSSVALPFLREQKKKEDQIAWVSFSLIAPPPRVEKTVLIMSVAKNENKRAGEEIKVGHQKCSVLRSGAASS